MAFEQRSLDDYIDVAQRIADFRERYPEGVLQPVLHDGANYRLIQAQGTDKTGEIVQQTFVVVIAAAFRTPDDPRPGIGMAWEVFPGRTNFTRGSELQNAETSAWGRAIIAVGASDSKRGIASREEVRNRQAEREDGLPVNRDGSLSRSRTTDEQKDAAGVMTSAQMAEHAALQAKRVEVRAGLARAGTVDDVWMDNSPPVDEISQDTAGTITPIQNKMIHARFTSLGIKSRVAYLEWARKALGLAALPSISALSYRQAGDLQEKLDQAAREGMKP